MRATSEVFALCSRNAASNIRLWFRSRPNRERWTSEPRSCRGKCSLSASGTVTSACELFSVLRMPIQDQRDGRGRAFIHGEIDQEPLAVGRDGVLLLTSAGQGTEGNANREQGRRRSGFQRLAIPRQLHRDTHHLAVQ